MRRSAVAWLGGALLVTAVACSDPTGVPDPSELGMSTFRAEIAGAVETTLRGETHMYFGREGRSNQVVWWLRLSAPPGPGPDSARIEFQLRLDQEKLPVEGTYPMWAGGYHRDSVFTDARLGLQTEDAETYLSRSGTLTVTDAVEGEVAAGRFQFTGQPLAGDSLGGPTIRVDGVFRAGAP